MSPSSRINFLDLSLARFNPKFLYWIFIPCDVISLVFQAAGGAISSTSESSDNVGVNMSLFGLAFQVFTLVVFILFSIDYLVRYFRQASRDPARYAPMANPRRFHVFLGALWAAIVFILIRCIYRIDELSDGYNGTLFANEGIFYGLESVMIVLAVFCLTLGHPGFGLPVNGQGHVQGDGLEPKAYTAPNTEMNSASESKPPSV